MAQERPRPVTLRWRKNAPVEGGVISGDEDMAETGGLATPIDPKNPAPWNNLANHYGHNGDVKKHTQNHTAIPRRERQAELGGTVWCTICTETANLEQQQRRAVPAGAPRRDGIYPPSAGPHRRTLVASKRATAQHILHWYTWGNSRN